MTILRQFILGNEGLRALDWWNAAALQKHFGLTPAQWIDYQTLVGDSGDGVPGCKGWGEKTTLPRSRPRARSRPCSPTRGTEDHTKTTASLVGLPVATGPHAPTGNAEN